jgi:hypothetical protein
VVVVNHAQHVAGKVQTAAPTQQSAKKY